MSGDFALVFTDGTHVWAARDRIGVRPLFYTRPGLTGIAFASEGKALTHFGTEIKAFPPGHLYDGQLDAFVCWASNYWDSPRNDDDVEHVKDHIKTLMFQAVERRVTTSERPVGFFLSGGLDSSIVAAIGTKLMGPIKTFSIGLRDAPDLLAAREMAAFLGSEHTEVIFTEKEGIAALRDVIWHLESYDTTTVRASVPMFLLSKYIAANTDVRVILSGEGADELFGGYLYFHDAPSEAKFLQETCRLVRDVHMFDVLRADRCTAAHGLELRVPFFDRDVVDYVMDGFRPALKMPKGGFEKSLLREAFQDMLPLQIAWRQKNGMSDAVGYSWVDALRKTGEHYQRTFRELFHRPESTVPYKWMPRWSTATDPSARTLIHFNDN
jgi:asparagine synthase (glutamine-hydrolysing)